MKNRNNNNYKKNNNNNNIRKQEIEFLFTNLKLNTWYIYIHTYYKYRYTNLIYYLSRFYNESYFYHQHIMK